MEEARVLRGRLERFLALVDTALTEGPTAAAVEAYCRWGERERRLVKEISVCKRCVLAQETRMAYLHHNGQKLIRGDTMSPGSMSLSLSLTSSPNVDRFAKRADSLWPTQRRCIPRCTFERQWGWGSILCGFISLAQGCHDRCPPHLFARHGRVHQPRTVQPDHSNIHVHREVYPLG